tara:strand:+ start:125 stop:394 length:270 start_codon:yes stop_codon:yes gene_type:complete
MAYFQAFDEIVAIKPAYGSEEIMILDQAIGMQDDAVSESSENVILTNHSRVACNGGGGSLGHPQIFLTLGNDGRVTCPYCSREFVKRAK